MEGADLFGGCRFREVGPGWLDVKKPWKISGLVGWLVGWLEKVGWRRLVGWMFHPEKINFGGQGSTCRSLNRTWVVFGRCSEANC